VLSLDVCSGFGVSQKTKLPKNKPKLTDFGQCETVSGNCTSCKITYNVSSFCSCKFGVDIYYVCCYCSDSAFVIYFLICARDFAMNRHNKDGNHYVVRREIVRSDTNSTRWYLNGKASSLKAVRCHCSYFVQILSLFLHIKVPFFHAHLMADQIDL